MFILRELHPIPFDYRKLHKSYGRGIIGIFEYLNKLIDMFAGPSPVTTESMLRAYSDGVKFVDLWTTAISVFVETQDIVDFMVSTFKSAEPEIGSPAPDWISSEELKGTIQIVFHHPTEELLDYLSNTAKVAKD